MNISVDSNRKLAYDWWCSLSINEMKALVAKYYPSGLWTLRDVEQRPHWIEEIYEKENNICDVVKE